MTDLRVAINIPIQADGSSGGVQQFVIGLLSGLSQLEGSTVEYVLVTHPNDPHWVDAYAGPNMEIHARPWAGPIERVRRFIPESVEGTVKRLGRRVLNVASEPTIQESAGFYESLNADVVHFPTQTYVKTALPSVYNPHDLQHRHLPEFFTDRQLGRRELQYRTGCEESDAIGVASQWVKDDLVDQYEIDRNKIYVIPLAPPVSLYENGDDHVSTTVRAKHGLPEHFCLYPAQTWPHKNHSRLLQALAKLRDDRGLTVNLVCTGKKNEYWPELEREIEELDLDDQVWFLGFVSGSDLSNLYAESQFTVIPTLFEAASFPMFEAWYEGSPVACSHVTSLPQIAGDAALIFDPESVDDIADAVERMATNESLRERLTQEGERRLSSLSWEQTAHRYELLYRQVHGNQLSPQEQSVINRANEGGLF